MKSTLPPLLLLSALIVSCDSSEDPPASTGDTGADAVASVPDSGGLDSAVPDAGAPDAGPGAGTDPDATLDAR